MAISIARYIEGDAEMWDDFVATSRNGTLFHTRKFLSYHPAGRFVDASLLFMKGGSVVALFPAVRQEEGGTERLVSHPGASYGGLVLARTEGVKTTGEILDALQQYAGAQGFKSILFLRLTPPSVRREWSDDQEYWLFRHGASLLRFEMDGSVYLRHMTEDSVLDHLDGKCRNMVRQAEHSGLTVRWSDDAAAFWPILEATLSARHGAKPTHTLQEFLRLRSLFREDVRLCAAFRGENMVAGVVVVSLHPRALYTLYIAQDYAHQESHPVHLILVELMRSAIREGRSVLHMGVSTEEGGQVLNDGLVFFKESFGMKPVRRESYALTIDS